MCDGEGQRLSLGVLNESFDFVGVHDIYRDIRYKECQQVKKSFAWKRVLCLLVTVGRIELPTSGL